ncbi:MAG: glycosyltransferase [Pseudomonadota bacterium]
MTARIAFLSCHLTGTGHMVRVLQLARAALARGHQVHVISGGRPLDHLATDGIDFVQLPPVTVCGLEFGVLRSPDGELVTGAYMATRRQALTEALKSFRPDALITELFPFGRRVMAPEFLAAIDTARDASPSSVVVCSVRDVPEPKPKRIDEAAARLINHYDGVVVHGDADFLPLETTWPLPPEAAKLAHHTGYVARAVPGQDAKRGNSVLVSTGGGVLGRYLLQSAAEASRHGDRNWHVLVGGADAPSIVRELTARYGHDRLLIEPARPDYPALLAQAGCAVTLAGYNTCAEQAGLTTPVILVPSEEADEKEQLIRARRFATFPGYHLIRQGDLTAETLAEMAEKLADGPDRPPLTLAIDDGGGAIARIEELMGITS